MTDKKIGILIADDEPLARDRLKRLLIQLGFNQLSEAENGQVALLKAQQYKPDIIMLDVRMPLLDGIEVAQTLKTDAQWRHTEFIFTTAYDEYALPAFDVCASGYLLKPINPVKLQSAITIAIERSKAAIHNKQTDHIRCQYQGNIQLIPLGDTRILLAEDKYVTLYHRYGQALVDLSLKQLEQNFPHILTRIHRNALINRYHLTGLAKNVTGQYHVKMNDTDIQPSVSRRWLPQIRQLLKQF